MIKKIKQISLVVIFIFSMLNGYSQKTSAYFEPKMSFKDGIELMQKEKYVAAQKKFENVFKSKMDKNNPLYIQAKFNYAIAAFHLQHRNTESLLLAFLEEYSQDNSVNLANFYLARWHFLKKSYSKCLKSLEITDLYLLSKEDQVEYKYRKGYSLFATDQKNEAKKYFYEVRNVESKFKSQASYYYAHIAYEERHLQTALTEFLNLKNDEYYASIVPYYIIQIYYLQQNYDQIFALAPELYEKSGEKRKPEIKRILAEAYYYKNDYPEAMRQMAVYMQNRDVSPSRDDHYMMGFSAYKTGDYTRALHHLKNLTNTSDTLAQNAYFIIADCYLKSNQKQYASNAFYEAYKMNIEEDITQESLLSYAKLQYEFSTNPFQSAIASFEEYVNVYPNSPRIDEVNEYLLTIYQTTQNYRSAIASLEKIKVKNHRLLTAYQQVAHLRGIELFNNGEFAEAIIHFDKSLTNDFDSRINAFNHYWKAEALYNSGNYLEAIKSYQDFQTSKSSFGTPEFVKSYYSIGYSYFKRKDFPNALIAFRKLISDPKVLGNDPIIGDSYNRAGDCFYMTKEFNRSVEMYSKAIEINTIDVDYALYQKSLALGAIGKMNDKKEALNVLMNRFPKSKYNSDALFELANTYVAINDLPKAVEEYNRLIVKYPKGKNVRPAKLKLGLTYYNMSEDQKALAVLKKLVEEYPGTEESKDALKNIRNIYVDNNNVDEFFAYVKNIPSATVSSSEQDSLTFRVVENRFLENDCSQAKKGADDYVQKFPSGYFILKAYYYKAECEFKSGNTDEALKAYQHIIVNFPNSNYQERSLIVAADILYQKKDYVKAAEYYTKLQPIASNQTLINGAITGRMRASYHLKNHQESILAAQELLLREKISDQLIEESRVLTIRSAMSTEQYDLAKKEALVLLKNKNEAGAEAYYVLSEIEFKEGKFDASEKRIFDLLSSGTPYEYWLAKSYILLGDIYVEKGNLFQAKHTYKSIVDNFEGQDLVKIADDKYKAVIKLEEEQEQSKNVNRFDVQQEKLEE